MRTATYLSGQSPGADPHLKVDFSSKQLKAGDLILLTTDGVHEHLKNSAILDTLRREHQITSPTAAKLEDIARQLVSQALQNGSQDNLTALIISINHLPDRNQHEAQQAFAHLPVPPVLKTGQTIDHYQVIDTLFSGTRSHLYKVKDLRNGHYCALKAPSLNFSDDPAYLQAFIREEWTGQTVKHCHLMRTFSSADKRFMYAVSEYIDGINLRQWMNEHPTPDIHQVRKISRQTAAGLRALQRQGIIHQDLKPENIMLNQDGQVKIIDYGSVQIAGVNELHPRLPTQSPER
ncbi:protein kinase domain-containing protein [Aliamphritea spongicola]|nr:protein kinase [Aliamphritea spongicola]